MATKQELLKTLTSLTSDYSELLSTYREANNSHFSESVPQPALFEKTNGYSFFEDDCKKMVAKNYQLNGEGKNSADCVKLTYTSKVVKHEIKKPEYKEKYSKPGKPHLPELTEHPLFTLLSLITVILLIVSIILLPSAYAKMSNAEKLIETSNIKKQEIISLVESYPCQNWICSINVYDGYKTEEEIGDRWNEDVYPSFENLGYPVKYNEDLRKTLYNDKIYASAYVSQVTSDIADYVAGQFIQYDESVMVEERGVYYMTWDFYNSVKGAKIGYWFMLVLSFIATIVLCKFSEGGIFAFTFHLATRPRVRKKYEQEMQQYAEEMKDYNSKVEKEKLAYDNTVKKYEKESAAGAKKYKENCDSEYKSIIAAINDYIESCKQYFARKKKFEEGIEKKKVVLKAQYDSIVKKIQAYPDIIPMKFMKLPTFEAANEYDLEKTIKELKAYIDYLESGRADTIKEATNCYIADKQAEEQRELLEQRLWEQRMEAEEQQRMLEEQAEEQRRMLEEQAERQEWINEQQRYQQQRMLEEQAEEQRRFNLQQAEEQRQFSEQQKCFATTCLSCRKHGGAFCTYNPNGGGGCRNYSPR